MSVENSYMFHIFQAVTEQPHGSIHQLQNIAVRFIWYETPGEDKTIGDDRKDVSVKEEEEDHTHMA